MILPYRSRRGRSLLEGVMSAAGRQTAEVARLSKVMASGESMLALIATLSAVLMVTAAEVPRHAPVDPVADFLRAADVNDFAAMEAVMDGGGPSFLARVSNCYLRRVYQTPDGITAAWMCNEGPARSRVVMGRLGVTAGNTVSVTVVREEVNERPAPDRAGSAFAD
jgi:hypothetical protein